MSDVRDLKPEKDTGNRNKYIIESKSRVAELIVNMATDGTIYGIELLNANEATGFYNHDADSY